MDVNRLHTVNRTVSHLRAETLVSKRIDNQLQSKSAKAHEVRPHTVNLHLQRINSTFVFVSYRILLSKGQISISKVSTFDADKDDVKAKATYDVRKDKIWDRNISLCMQYTGQRGKSTFEEAISRMQVNVLQNQDQVYERGIRSIFQVLLKRRSF